MTISEIIERLEKADRANGQLDRELFMLHHGYTRIEQEYDSAGPRYYAWSGEKYIGEITSIDQPQYTASIDAAVQLCERVLPDYLWGITQGTDGDLEFQGNVWPNMQPFDASRDRFGYHSKPAIALCIAILRALQPKEGE